MGDTTLFINQTATKQVLKTRNPKAATSTKPYHALKSGDQLLAQK
jgi:hypothetical protein